MRACVRVFSQIVSSKLNHQQLRVQRADLLLQSKNCNAQGFLVFLQGKNEEDGGDVSLECCCLKERKKSNERVPGSLSGGIEE